MRIILIMLTPFLVLHSFAQTTTPFSWPAGKEAAISLSFDDARASQVEAGTTLLDSFQAKATFYVVPAAVKERLEGWKKAVASGHEIGSHSFYHPCSGNFTWSRMHALENYTLDSMKIELKKANDTIQNLLGVRPAVFAYPCGQKFVGRGTHIKSYAPLVAKNFISGRGFMDEAPNDPSYIDFAQITGIEMDGKDFEQILPLLLDARKNGRRVVLAGHEIAEGGFQTTRLAMLRKLIAYAQDPENKLWIAPVGPITTFIKEHHKTLNSTYNKLSGIGAGAWINAGAIIPRLQIPLFRDSGPFKRLYPDTSALNALNDKGFHSICPPKQSAEGFPSFPAISRFGPHTQLFFCKKIVIFSDYCTLI